MDDEPAQWERAQSGDPAAFGALFDAHRDRVFGQALRLTSSVHDAEDVTALVFLEAWRRRSKVRVVEGSIVAWLLVTTNLVAKNLARARRRYGAAMASLPPTEPTPDFTPEVDDRLDAGERTAAARNAFARLSKNDQNVITLCVIEELTIAQASETLGIPQGTVKSRLSRAKKKLSHVLSDVVGPGSAIGGAE